MLRGTADVEHVILLEFLLEPRLAPPIGVLPPVVGEHLLRDPVLRHGGTVRLQNELACVAAIHPETGNVA